MAALAWLGEAGRVLSAYRAWAAAALVAALLVTAPAAVALSAAGDPQTTAAPAPAAPIPTVPGPAAPAPTPPSDPADDDYAFLFENGNGPIGFDPCEPAVEVRYNPAGEPYDAAADVAASVDLIAEGLGRAVTYAGVTDAGIDAFSRLALAGDPPAVPTIVVGWVATPADLGAGPDVVGQAHPIRVGDEIAAGTVALVASGDDGLTPGLGPDAWGVVMIHELGHAAGLDHVDDEAEIMYPSVVPGHPAAWGAGDLNGLRRLAGTCPGRQISP